MASFAEQFFADYITGQELPDYASLLDHAGMLLRKANEGDVTLGPVTLEFDGESAIISTNTIIGSQLYKAGLDRGDEVLAIGRLLINSADDWDDAIGRYQPGDSASINFVQRGIRLATEISFDEDGELEVVTFESADRDVSDEQLAFRDSWLGSQ